MKRTLRKAKPHWLTSAGYAEANSKEHGQQVALFMWAQENRDKYPAAFSHMFAIPNGGERHKAVASRLKAEGVKSGVPDVMLAVPALKPMPYAAGYVRGYYCGLFIENKREKKGRVSDDQDEWKAKLIAAGYAVVVCRGFEEARDAIIAYLTGTLTIE